MKKIAVLVSGGGTNLQAILDAQTAGVIKSGKVTCVVSSSKNAYALERAKNADVPAVAMTRAEFGDGLCDAICDYLISQEIDYIVLAGFLVILKGKILKEFENRIINIHPSLIPSFCGDGFYGLKVHEAALSYGVKVTGATVHFVNEITDGGKIIMQQAVEVREGDTPEVLQKRVMEEAEWKILPQAIEKVCSK